MFDRAKHSKTVELTAFSHQLGMTSRFQALGNQYRCLHTTTLHHLNNPTIITTHYKTSSLLLQVGDSCLLISHFIFQVQLLSLSSGVLLGLLVTLPTYLLVGRIEVKNSEVKGALCRKQRITKINLVSPSIFENNSARPCPSSLRGLV